MSPEEFAVLRGEFVAKLKVAVGKLKVGKGVDEGVAQGPLISAEAILKVEQHIADAVSRGAQIVTGGARHELGGNFFQPTIF